MDDGGASPHLSDRWEAGHSWGIPGAMLKLDPINDSPISTPNEDLYGADQLARALADRIACIKGAVGSTIAINGPWGSGKSSIINLIRHHLKPAVENGELEIVNFTSWWFRGEEALTMAFLQELQAVCRKTLGDQAKSIFKQAKKKLFARKAMTDWIATAREHGWARATQNLALEHFSEPQSLEDIFVRLGDLLLKQRKRIVVIIDDIDRLTPDEALQMFRLVKSVGRLPNVIYLLSFDRQLAEKAIQERFPSEGSHFLEKIIQASFDLPPPSRDVLTEVLVAEIEKIIGKDPEGDRQYLSNTILGSVVPYITTPRHIVRFANAMAITYPAVANEVNVADYLALEAMRLFEPKLYQRVRQSKGIVCGSSDKGDYDGSVIAPFLKLVPRRRRDIAGEALRRLFPRFEQYGHGTEFIAGWQEQRRACTKRYFDTYFQLQIGDDVLSRADLDTFIEHSADKEATKRALLKAAQERGKSGRSGVPVLLEELNSQAHRIPHNNIEPLLAAMFEVADELISADPRDIRNELVNNKVRIHWLMRRLVMDRFILRDRSILLHEALQSSSLIWLAHFAESAYHDHYPRGSRSPEPPENCLVEQQDADNLRIRAVEAIRAAGYNGQLIESSHLGELMERWRVMSADDGRELRLWVAEQMQTKAGLIALARAFTGQSLAYAESVIGNSLPDRVGTLQAEADTEGMSKFVDAQIFRLRLQAASTDGSFSEEDLAVIRNLLTAWQRRGAV